MTGRTLSGRFLISSIVGTGGMSVVYRAYDLEGRQDVAVKVLRSELMQDEDFVRRFDNEAHAASQMSHPNIVNMLGVYQDGDVRYLVMEFVNGRTLKELIRQTGRIKPQRAVQMALRILAGVDHAHRNHIVHRDIKPQNILVDREGNVKVADFGIARSLHNTSVTLTADGNIMGSVHYFSPEQARGKAADEKSDLYSVGVVLYEMLTGEVPFDGESPVDIAIKQVQMKPRAPRQLEPEISVGLEEVLLKALEKDPNLRYLSAADMANDLKRALRMPQGGFIDFIEMEEEEELEPPPEERAPRLSFGQRLKRYLKLIGVLLVIGGVVGIGFGVKAFYENMFVKLRVPTVKLLNIEDSVAILEERDIQYIIAQQFHDEIGMGYVISQEPEAGTLIWPEERVTITVSLGKGQQRMPELTGISIDEALEIAAEYDLKADDIVYEVSDAHAGEVIEQVPGVGEWVMSGDSIRLRVSGESAIMPSLSSRTPEEAGEVLKQNGFELGIVKERLSDMPEGQIISQDIAAGEKALVGSKVNVTISQPREASYRARTEISITVPEGGGEVTCRVDDGSGYEREVYRAYYEAGDQVLQLDVDSLVEGAHTLSIYIDGEKVQEISITFE